MWNIRHYIKTVQYYKWYIIDHVVANKYFQICWWCAKSNKIIFYKFLASFQAPSTYVIGEIKDVSWSHDVTSVIFWPRIESESWNMHHNINLKKDKTSHYPHFVLSFSDLLNLYTSSKFSNFYSFSPSIYAWIAVSEDLVLCQ